MQKNGMSKKIALSLIFMGALSVNTAFAQVQENTTLFELDQMVVTATKNLQELKKVPASVSVITAKDIKDKNVQTLADALKTVTGVVVSRPKGMASANSGISLRGFGQSNFLVLYDGVPLNIPYDGSVAWSGIPVNSVERIEIVRGAASSLYGGHAVGGVINIISKEPDEKMKVHMNTLYGSDNMWRKDLDISQKVNDKWSYNLSYEKTSTDGFQNKVASTSSSGSSTATGNVGTGLVVTKKTSGSNRYVLGSPGDNAAETETYRAKIKYDFDEDKDLSYSFTHSKFKYWTENPESYIKDSEGNQMFEGSVMLPTGKWINFSEGYFTDYYGRKNVDIHSLRYNDYKNKFNIVAGFTDSGDNGYSTGDYFDGNTPGSNVSYPTKTYEIELNKVWDIGEKHTIVAGTSYQRDEMTRAGTSLAHWHDKNSVTSVNYRQKGKDSIYAAFVQDEYAINDTTSLYSGLRFDHYRKHDGQMIDYTKATDNEYKSENFSEISPKLAVQFNPTENFNYYISYGHSFNPPSLYKIYRTDKYYDANPSLKPEVSDTFEIGLKADLNEDTRLEMALYRANTDDLIDAKRKENGKKEYVNISKAYRRGFEVSLSRQMDDRWSSYFNYQWQLVKDGDGEVIYDYPKDTFHTGIKYDYAKWNGNLDLEYVSDSSNPGTIKYVYYSYNQYCLTNLGVNYEMSENAKIGFNIDNLFDKQYYDGYKAPGRTYSVSVDYTF